MDIGASGGIDNRWSKIPLDVTAVLFEPDPREFQKLSTSNSNNIVLKTALSDQKGKATFNLCQKQEVSSIFKPNFEILNLFPLSERFSINDSISIDTDTIDNQTKVNQIKNIDFIKIDTQGYELAILKGAHNTIENVIGLEVEVEFLQIYENQPTFGEVNTFLIKKGFELFDLKRYFWKRKNTKSYENQKRGQIIFADALYFRTPESILKLPNISSTKIWHAVNVYMAYGYFDLTENLIELCKDKDLVDQQTYLYFKSALRSHEMKNNKLISKVKRKVLRIIKKVQNFLYIDSGVFYSDNEIGNL